MALASGFVCSGTALALVGGAGKAGATSGSSDLTLSQPQNIIVDTTSPAQTSAVVSYALPAASDPDDTASLPAPSCTPAPGSTFSIGVTTVTCTVDLSLAVRAAAVELSPLQATLTSNQSQLSTDQGTLTADQAAITGDQGVLQQDQILISQIQNSLGDAETQLSIDQGEGAPQSVIQGLQGQIGFYTQQLQSALAAYNRDAADLNAQEARELVDQAVVHRDQTAVSSLVAAVAAAQQALESAEAIDDDTPSSVSVTFTVSVLGAAGQLASLNAGVLGVGSGTSLADKLGQAQAYLAAGDLQDTCSTLNAFANEVHAQSGKQIPASQATQFSAAAQNIQAVLGC